MKKLIWILSAIVLILGGLGYLAYANAPVILAEIISHKTQTPVTIKDIKWQHHGFTIEDLTIANPKEARLPVALKAEAISVETHYAHYLDNPIGIDTIHVDHIYLNIQLYNKEQTEGNWQTIMANMEGDTQGIFSFERSALIKKLILTNIQIDLILANGKLYHLSPIDRLEFDNITSDEGVPTQEISEIILQKMLHSVFIENGLKSIIEAPVDVIKKILPIN